MSSCGATANLFLQSSDPQAVENGFWPWRWLLHLLHRIVSWLGLITFFGIVGNLMNDMIPFRQRGQGIEPGGAEISELMLLVEQRLSAHLVQSSWPQPKNHCRAYNIDKNCFLKLFRWLIINIRTETKAFSRKKFETEKCQISVYLRR